MLTNVFNQVFYNLLINLINFDNIINTSFIKL